ncbi:hypothetical protein F8566_28825 [Actinomadura rudentiformis]|uniref:Uncharacterized protein n=1 Tax=Actinomadura rudentiformis TaxID=359158 RepID=A0A6H9YL46_9ACTN|nr:hypothetical protein F8566_28825 [Actinomadura rudentiformis]
MTAERLARVNKKFLKFGAIAFVAWYVISRPEGAASLVNSALGGLGNAAESLSQFVSAIP